MENNSTNILRDEESMDIVAVGKTRERETNAPCQRTTAEDTGTRETNVSEEEAAAVRRDGGPLTIADQQLRQEDSAASRPPSQTRKGAAAEAAPRTADPDPGEGAKTGGCRPNIIDISRAGTPKARPAEVVQPAAGDA